MRLAHEIDVALVKEDEIAIFWLGQAGYLIKDSFGRRIAIDVYLTDCCERAFGFKRISPKLISPSEFKTDVLFSTHEHMDHFDVDAIPIIMANKDTRIIGAKTSIAEGKKMGLDESRLTYLETGKTLDIGWARFTSVYADHGELAPDAIGVVLEINGITIYYTGDTAYRPEQMQFALAQKPDIIILPINGAYGNLDSVEAAQLAKDSGAKVAVPCHFWTFLMHGGDPKKFEDEMKQKVPACEAKFLTQGEMFKFKRA